jgi:hypothetical protein
MACVSQRLADGYRQRERTPNSSVSPLMLARNSSSSVGTGVDAGGDSDSGFKTSDSASMRVKEERDDPTELRDRFTTSKPATEHSNVVPSKEDSASEDSVGLETISSSVIRGG